MKTARAGNGKQYLAPPTVGCHEKQARLQICWSDSPGSSAQAISAILPCQRGAESPLVSHKKQLNSGSVRPCLDPEYFWHMALFCTALERNIRTWNCQFNSYFIKYFITPSLCDLWDFSTSTSVQTLPICYWFCISGTQIKQEWYRINQQSKEIRWTNRQIPKVAIMTSPNLQWINFWKNLIFLLFLRFFCFFFQPFCFQTSGNRLTERKRKNTGKESWSKLTKLRGTSDSMGMQTQQNICFS